MNIVYFVSSLSFGGAEKQTVLDANLMANEHQVHFVSFSTGPLNDILSDKVQFKALARGSYLKNALALSRYCNENKIDIIHTALFAAFIISSLSSLFSEAKVIWHFHSHEYDIPLKSKLVIKLCARIPGVKVLAFVNKELIEHFQSFNFPKEKVMLLYNHSTIGKHDYTAKNHAKVRVGYLGRVIRLKRVHYLVDLAKELLVSNQRGFEIHVVGDGDQFENLRTAIADENLSDIFILHGFQTDVNSFYKTFDLFVNPSEEECLSIAMIDAGMYGLPIVAFNVGGNNEIVKHKETGFVVKNLQEFINACQELIEDKDLRVTMGKFSQDHCYQLFSEPVHKKELLHLYKELLK